MWFLHFFPSVLLAYPSRSLQRNILLFHAPNSAIWSTFSGWPGMSEQQLHNPAKTLNHGTGDTEYSCFSMSYSGKNVLGFWDRFMLLTDVAQELWVTNIHTDQQLSWLSCDPKHPGGREKLSHCFSWFNALTLLPSHWDLHLDFSFFAYTQSCRTLVQVLEVDASAWPYWFLWIAGEKEKGYFCPMPLTQSDSGICSIKLSEQVLHLQI